MEDWVASGLERMRRGEVSPYALVDEIVARLLRGERSVGIDSGNGGER